MVLEKDANELITACRMGNLAKEREETEEMVKDPIQGRGRQQAIPALDLVQQSAVREIALMVNANQRTTIA